MYLRILEFFKSLIDFSLVRMRRILSSIGIDIRKRTDDRNILEKTLFPYFIQQDECKKILFVGCAWFTKSYNKLFENKDYWTLEIDPSLKKYGSKNHIVDSLENITQYFKPDELDLIICNGVFGWGLDEKTSIENSCKGCFETLRKGGVFVLGWNDIPEHRPFLLTQIEALNLFNPFLFEPLNSSQYLTANPNRHTYSFYCK